ncbi:hypothetical protein [Nocardia sp. NPDC051750]|uniref:hypothetical protein n=1 Tax=Nocardia sp. NPDC051750 TaxID=3364325 RepID=UPI0037A7BEF6
MRAMAKVGAAGVIFGGLVLGGVPAQAAPGIAVEPAAPVAEPAVVADPLSSLSSSGSGPVSAGSSVLSCIASTISAGPWCLPG